LVEVLVVAAPPLAPLPHRSLLEVNRFDCWAGGTVELLSQTFGAAVEVGGAFQPELAPHIPTPLVPIILVGWKDC
jgi:hypothetical protein